MVQEPFKPGLETSSAFTPLRRFRSTLESYTFEDRDDRRGGTFRVIVFNHKELEVIESTEPYPFPIAVINISYSTKTETRWDAFAKSLKKHVPDAADPDVLVGKQQEWAMLPFGLRQALSDEDGSPKLDARGAQEWGVVMSDAWQIASVAGIGSAEEMEVAFTELLLTKADGKTEKEFYEALLTDPKVTARPDVVTDITDRKLLSTLLTSGKLTRDDQGVLHKVGA